MTQAEINLAVALVTGETLCTVSGLGFSIADPDFVDHDPEPSDIEELIVESTLASLRQLQSVDL